MVSTNLGGEAVKGTVTVVSPRSNAVLLAIVVMAHWAIDVDD